MLRNEKNALAVPVKIGSNLRLSDSSVVDFSQSLGKLYSRVVLAPDIGSLGRCQAFGGTTVRLQGGLCQQAPKAGVGVLLNKC